MRRGFKAEAKSLALELRREIGLTPIEPFNPHALAELYGVRVFPVPKLSPPSSEGDSVSGLLHPVGTGAIILENSSHSDARCRLTVSHEMSHLVLYHEFPALIVDPSGCRDVNPDQEDEANCLAGELVLPTERAHELAKNGLDDAQVARLMGISIEAARWRMNVSGARKRAAHSFARRLP